MYVCNSTATQNYTENGVNDTLAVNQADNPVRLYLNSQLNTNITIGYGNQSNATAVAVVGASLFRDGLPATNPEITTLAAGVYAYKVNSTGSQNYTSNSTGLTYYLNITKAVTSATLTLSPPSPVTYGTENNASCSGTNPEALANLYRNGKLVNSENGVNVTLGAGSYDYVCNVSGTQNYSSAEDSASYTINKADHAIHLALNSFESDQAVSYPSATNATGWLETGQGSATLYRNSSAVLNPEVATLGAGYYNYTYVYPESENYTAQSVTRILAVNRGDTVLNLSADPGWSITYGDNVNVSCSADNDEAAVNLYRNGLDVTGENNAFVVLGAGSHDYVCNNTETQNYTAAQSSNVLDVGKASSAIELYLNGSRAKLDVFSGESLNATAVLQTPSSGNAEIWTNYSDGVWKLWDSGPSPLENVSVLAQVGVWNFSANFSNENYTEGSESWPVNVSIVIDTTPPLWSSPQESPADPAVYSPGQGCQFNVTWNEPETGVDAVWIEHNFTGALANYTVAGSAGDEYYYDWSGLGAGYYVWRGYANNTDGYVNKTDWFGYAVNKAATTTELYLNEVRCNLSVLYPTVTNASAYASALIVGLYRDGSAVLNPEVATLGAGYYNYTAVNTGNENYTGSYETFFLEVNMSVSSCTLGFDPVSPITYGTQVNASCSCNNPEASAQLFRNGTGVTGENNVFVTLGAGSYDYVCNVTGTQNYTSASDNQTYVVNQAIPAPNLTITPSSSETYGTETTANCSYAEPEVTPQLYRNSSL
jgi:hypothetical protein